MMINTFSMGDETVDEEGLLSFQKMRTDLNPSTFRSDLTSQASEEAL
jgi:hypothetical protein